MDSYYDLPNKIKMRENKLARFWSSFLVLKYDDFMNKDLLF